MCGVEAAPHFSTPGAKATDFSRFGAHLYPVKKARARECSEETNFLSCLWWNGMGVGATYGKGGEGESLSRLCARQCAAQRRLGARDRVGPRVGGRREAVAVQQRQRRAAPHRPRSKAPTKTSRKSSSPRRGAQTSWYMNAVRQRQAPQLEPRSRYSVSHFARPATPRIHKPCIPVVQDGDSRLTDATLYRYI